MSALSKTAAPTDSAPNTPAAAATAPSLATAGPSTAAEYNGNVPIDLIEPDPNNRDKIDKARVTALAATIASEGLLQPIVLRLLANGLYRIMAGEHRWRAHLELKRTTIAARIFRNETDLSAAKKKSVENALRVDLTPMERAKRFKELEGLGSTQKEIGTLFGGLSQPVVANAMRLLGLPAEVQTMVSEGQLSEAAGVSIARFVKWPKVCAAIADTYLDRGDNTKTLNNSALPYAWRLRELKLVEEINTGSHYSSLPLYTLPPEVKADADFIESGQSTYYLLPDKSKPVAVNKWAELRPKLEVARKAAEAATKKKDANREGKTTAGMSAADKASRAKTIANNKRSRREAALAHTAVIEVLSKTKGFDAAQVAVLAKVALGAYWKYGKDLAATAQKIGISLGKGFDQHSLASFASMKPEDAVRLVVAGMMESEAQLSAKSSHGVDEKVALVIGAKALAAIKTEALVLEVAARVKAPPAITGKQTEIAGIKAAKPVKKAKPVTSKKGAKK